MKASKLLKFFAEPPTQGPASTVAVRLMAGGVFLWEGLLKFVYPNMGVGRFAKLGIPLPQLSAPAIALLEIGGGLLVMSGLFTRFITVPFIIEMVVAILTTKISLYLGVSPLPQAPTQPNAGIWAVLHDVRSDFAQIMTCVFLLAAGPGRWSLDAVLQRRRRTRRPAMTAAVESLPQVTRRAA